MNTLEGVEGRPLAAPSPPIDDEDCWSRRSSIDSVCSDTDIAHQDERHPTTAAELGFSVAELQVALALAERMCKENLNTSKLKETRPTFPKTPSSPMFARRHNGTGGNRFMAAGSPAGSPAPGTPVLGSRAGSPAREATPSGVVDGVAGTDKTVGLAGTVLKSGRYVPPKQLLLYVVRMGSFTSTKKIPNEDHQDDAVVSDVQEMKLSSEHETPDTDSDASSGMMSQSATPADDEGANNVVQNEEDASAEAWRRLLLKRCRHQLPNWPPLLKRRWCDRTHHYHGTGVNGTSSKVTFSKSGNSAPRARKEVSDSNEKVENGRQVSLTAQTGCLEVHRGSTSSSSAGNFRLMQWNVLSQALGTARDSFALCPGEALAWDQRRYRMLEEILAHRAEIVCLQEVDHYKFLEAHLAKMGYKGSFYAKPDSPCVYIPDNNGPDGCAIFYDANKFQLVEEFTRVIQVWKVQSNQVILVNVLRHLETNQEVCIATTHLKAKEGALLATIRHEEGLDLVSFVKECAGNRPVIVCGDFNATPEEPVYAAMLRSGLKMGSAYALRTGNETESGVENKSLKTPKEPEYTTWKVRTDGESKSTLDYVFYSRKRLQVDAILEFPSGGDMGPERLPSLKYASDHLSLVCDFSFKRSSSEVLRMATASTAGGALESCESLGKLHPNIGQSAGDRDNDAKETDGEEVMRER